MLRMSHEPAEFDDLPEPLRADLGRLYRADVTPSPAVDQAVLNRARAYFAGRRRGLLLRRAAGAAAAVILITAAVIPTINRYPHTNSAAVARRAEDVNRDGVVDIRDALALQRAVEGGRPTANDVTGDGVTDRRDVDAIAMLAVRLDAPAGKGAAR